MTFTIEFPGSTQTCNKVNINCAYTSINVCLVSYICFVALRLVHPVIFACACAGCGSVAERWRSSRAATWVTCSGTSRPTPSRAASPRLSTRTPPALPRYVRTSVADPDPDPAIFFSDKSPYTFPGGVAKIVNKNAARVAEVTVHSSVTDP
jgi:hypothetical protein